MSEVSKEITQKIAHLARLELTDSEVEQFTKQLSDVLGYVEQLGEVNTDGVEPMTTPLEMETPLREDEAKPYPRNLEGKPKILDSANETLFDGFKVPQIV